MVVVPLGTIRPYFRETTRSWEHAGPLVSERGCRLSLPEPHWCSGLSLPVVQYLLELPHRRGGPVSRSQAKLTVFRKGTLR